MSSYQLMPHVQLVPFDDHVLFYRKDKASLKLKSTEVKDLSHLLVRGFSKETLKKNLHCTSENAHTIIKKLLSEQLISEKKTTEPRFDRLSAYMESFSEDAYKKLKNSSVLLLGVGGLGSHIFQHLLANGINTTVLDHDRVSESNLSRQTLYTLSDVGRLKIEVCAQYGERQKLPINTLLMKITSALAMAEILARKNYDLIISTIDEPVWLATQYVIKGAKEASVPVLRANSRAIGPLFIKGHPCPLCYSEAKSKKVLGAQAVIERYQQGFLARRSAAISYELAFVGLICVREAIHFLVGKNPQSLGHELSWSKEELSLKATPVEKTSCSACGS